MPRCKDKRARPLVLGGGIARLHHELIYRVQSRKAVGQPLPIAVLKQRAVLCHLRPVEDAVNGRHGRISGPARAAVIGPKCRYAGRRSENQVIHSSAVLWQLLDPGVLHNG